MAFTIPFKTTADLKGVTSLSDKIAKFGLVMDGLEKGLKLFTGTMSVVTDTIGTLAKEYKVLDRETRRLTSAMEGMQKTHQVEFLENIEKTSRKTGIATDDLNKLSASLLHTMLDKADASKALNTVMDISHAKNLGLKQTSDLLTNAIEGNTKALQKKLPTLAKELDAIDKINDPMIKQKALLDLLSEAHKDARFEINKGIASWDTINNSIGDFVEELGRALFNSKSFNDSLAGISDGLRDVVAVTGDVISIYVDFLGLTNRITKAQNQREQAHLDTLAAFQELNEFVIKTIGFFKEAYLTFKLFGKAVEWLGAVMVNSLISAFEQLISIVAKAEDSMIAMGKFAGMDIKPFGGITEHLSTIKKSSDEYVSDLKKDMDDITELIVSQEIKTGIAIDNLGKKINKFKDDVGFMGPEPEKGVLGGTIRGAVVSAAGKVGGKPGGGGGKKDDSVKELIELGNAYAAWEDRMLRAQIATVAFYKEQVHLIKAIADASQKTNDAIEAVTERAGSAADAIRDVLGLNDELMKSVEGAAESTAGVIDDAMRPVMQKVVELAELALNSVVSLASGSAKSAHEMRKHFLDMITKLMISFGTFLITSGTGLSALQSSIFGAAIAAGVAMISAVAFSSAALKPKATTSSAVSSGMAPIKAATKMHDAKAAPGTGLTLIVPAMLTKSQLADVTNRAMSEARRLNLPGARA